MCIHSYLKAVLRYKFLILDTCHPDTLCFYEQRFVLFFEAKRVLQAETFGKPCCRGECKSPKELTWVVNLWDFLWPQYSCIFYYSVLLLVAAFLWSLLVSRHHDMRKLKQLFFVLMTVILSYHDCSDVPLTCPGENVSTQSFPWRHALQFLIRKL